jgi:hypothetical protein
MIKKSRDGQVANRGSIRFLHSPAAVISVGVAQVGNLAATFRQPYQPVAGD